MNFKQIKRIRTKPSFFKVVYNYFLGLYIKFLINIPNNKCKIITIVRDPIARDISMMFQLSHVLIYEYVMENKKVKREEKNLMDFLDDIYFKLYNKEYALEWFDSEFKRTTGIDVYKYEFDKNNGYQLINEKNYNILILKFEKLEELGNIIANFLKIEDFKLIKSNRAEGKWYSIIYENYKKGKKYNKQFLVETYSSKYVKHFYSKEEINKFIMNHANNR
jgi:hypothetical protein